jgi:hypothetical protein
MKEFNEPYVMVIILLIIFSVEATWEEYEFVTSSQLPFGDLCQKEAATAMEKETHSKYSYTRCLFLLFCPLALSI